MQAVALSDLIHDLFLTVSREALLILWLMLIQCIYFSMTRLTWLFLYLQYV